ncbi:MAG: helix-turn-helix transcriptional regulator [Moraxella sp.]|nr:helix-turn-helix transcriptional regulator [Moraxella sp.]
MFDMQIIGERLREERTRLNLTQYQLSSMAEVTQSTYSKYERGERVPTLQAVNGFYRLGMDITYLLTGERSTPTEGVHLSTLEQKWLSLYRDSKDKVALMKLAEAFESL